jgi:hypothetical protein
MPWPLLFATAHMENHDAMEIAHRPKGPTKSAETTKSSECSSSAQSSSSPETSEAPKTSGASRLQILLEG